MKSLALILVVLCQCFSAARATELSGKACVNYFKRSAAATEVGGNNRLARKQLRPAAHCTVAQPTPEEAVLDFKGSEKELLAKVVKVLLTRQFGDDAPLQGPFMIERCRIAGRIQQCERRGLRMDNYRLYFKQKIETLVATKDNRCLRELRNNTYYIEQQLGLPELQASSRI